MIKKRGNCPGHGKSMRGKYASRRERDEAVTDSR